MENHWALERLQLIRTMMERGSLYRRALAPSMAWAGGAGILAAVGGVIGRIETQRGFASYWMIMSLVVIAGVLLVARRAAFRDAEPFWSPPARRVAQAMAPPLLAGLVIGCLALGIPSGWEGSTRLLPFLWMIAYGCGIHSAGFFMPRGVQKLGWLFLLGGLIGALGKNWLGGWMTPVTPHIIMGLTFGAAHLFCGLYLYLTAEKRSAS